MIHRALLGSIERFTGILIEHYAGEFPGWLAPNQINILTVGKVDEYLKRKTFYHDKTLPYIMPKIKSLEIDDIIDFELVKHIIRNKKKFRL